MSHRLTTSACGLLVRCGKYECETLPQPMTPTRIRFVSPPSPTLDSASAAPAAALCPTNARRSMLFAVMTVSPGSDAATYSRGLAGGNGNRQERGIRVGKKRPPLSRLCPHYYYQSDESSFRGAGMATANLNDVLRRLARGMDAVMLDQDSDRQLVRRALAERDAAALQAIVHRHGAMVY